MDPILFLLGIQRDHVEIADAKDDDLDELVLMPVPDLPPA